MVSAYHTGTQHLTQKIMIGYLILGLIAGALGKLIMPGKDGGGILMTMLLGIGGAFLGGFIGNAIGFLPSANPGGLLPGIGSIITATIGAFLLLLIFRFIKSKKK